MKVGPNSPSKTLAMIEDIYDKFDMWCFAVPFFRYWCVAILKGTLKKKRRKKR